MPISKCNLENINQNAGYYNSPLLQKAVSGQSWKWDLEFRRKMVSNNPGGARFIISASIRPQSLLRLKRPSRLKRTPCKKMSKSGDVLPVLHLTKASRTTIYTQYSTSILYQHAAVLVSSIRHIGNLIKFWALFVDYIFGAVWPCLTKFGPWCVGSIFQRQLAS